MKSVWHENISKSEIIEQTNLDELYHPASLLKLFVARAVQRILESDLPATFQLSKQQTAHIEKHRPRLEFALGRSLSDSDNDALRYLVDFISEAESGLELADLQELVLKRERLHCFFSTEAGYSDELRLPNKCFEFDYYGRDRQLVELQANQCCLTDVVLLMKEIWRSGTLLPYLQRSLSVSTDYQAQNFLAARLAIDGDFYSKAGWNSKVRHDALIYQQADDFYLWVEMSNI